MKKQLRIPTLLALLILIIGLVATAFATNLVQKVFIKADTSTVREVKKSNISDKSFTVSWITDSAVSGAVVYKDTKSFSAPVLDDRVQSGSGNDKFFTHHITVSFLKPATGYTYKIISGGQEFNDPGYTVITAPTVNSVSQLPSPVYGTVLKQDQTPANDAIVYLSMNNSSLLSAMTKSKGNWIIPLSTIRTTDLSGYLPINPRGDTESILVQGGKDGVSEVKTVTGNDAPVPNIILGESHDFSAAAMDNIAVQPTVSPADSTKTGFVQPSEVSPTPAILMPGDNSTIKDGIPTFSGTGLPGQVVQIIVHSDQNIVGNAVVDSTGRWSWAPSQQLDSGEHTVTIATADETGNTKNITQKFIVLASGTGVTESATPSATLSPTIIITPSPTPIPVATRSAIPTSGNGSITMLLLAVGFLIIISGLKMFQVSNLH